LNIGIDIDNLIDAVISVITTFLEAIFVDALGGVTDGIVALLISREGILGDKIYLLIIVVIVAMWAANRKFNR